MFLSDEIVSIYPVARYQLALEVCQPVVATGGFSAILQYLLRNSYIYLPFHPSLHPSIVTLIFSVVNTGHFNYNIGEEGKRRKSLFYQINLH